MDNYNFKKEKLDIKPFHKIDAYFVSNYDSLGTKPNKVIIELNDNEINIKNDFIIPVFQGIVDNSQNVIKYECLMRLKQYDDNEEKLVSPIFFLDAAVNTQQYDKLTTIISKMNESIYWSIQESVMGEDI